MHADNQIDRLNYDGSACTNTARGHLNRIIRKHMGRLFNTVEVDMRSEKADIAVWRQGMRNETIQGYRLLSADHPLFECTALERLAMIGTDIPPL